MTEQRKKRALIEYAVAKPFVDAVALGGASAAFAVVSNGPAMNWGLIGWGCSLAWYWGSSNLVRGKKKRTSSVGRSITVNSLSGSRQVSIFNQVAPQFIARETVPEMFSRWVRGTPARAPSAPRINKPAILDEFVFHSQCGGHLVELLEGDVTRFLLSAWRNRDRGSGLGQRRWVREWRQRPQWYKDLGPSWYFAFAVLLQQVEQASQRQLVIEQGHQQYALKYDPHKTLEVLKWAEATKRNIPEPKSDEPDISLDRGEGSF